MIKGLLVIDFKDQKVNLLVFKCPHCKAKHGALITLGEPFKFTDKINVWSYKFLSDRIIELRPSWNNEKKCGYHSSGTWQIFVKILEPEHHRNLFIELWFDT